MRLNWLKHKTAIAMLLVLTPALAVAQPKTLDVVHDHAVGSCRGRLTIDDSGMRFESQRKDHSRQWKFVDVQELRVEPGRLRVLSYEDRRWTGVDRSFTFTFSKEEKLWPDLRELLSAELGRRLVVGIPELAATAGASVYRLAVKHRRGSRGSEGVLSFGPTTLVYSSDEPDDSRTWTYGDIESISSSGPFQLTLNTYEHERFHYGSRRTFEFQLKEPLSEAVYNDLWRRVNTASGLEVLQPRKETSQLEPTTERLGRQAEEAVQRILSAREIPGVAVPLAEPPLVSASVASAAPFGTPAAILAQHGLPAELTGVIKVESGGNRLALSPKGARGLWQFMPETARRYGLTVSVANDERTDPEKSTHAAARYLKDLYGLFGDWRLALAGYNAGEQRVQTAVRRAGTPDFGKLAHLLPRETQNYVPAVMSAFGRLQPSVVTPVPRVFALTSLTESAP